MTPPQHGQGSGLCSGGAVWACWVDGSAVRGIEQFATERELAGTMAVGEKAVVANAMEAVGD